MTVAEELKADQYDAFISYSRRDREFARRLEKQLEAFKPPKDLAVPHRRLKVFRDEGDLTGSEYFQAIDRYLRGSAKLILVCSPATRQSEYVDDEIRRFVAARGAEHVIPILLAGIPNNEATPEEAAEQAFPDALCEAMRMPLATSYLGFGGTEKVHKGIFEGPWYTVLANLYDVSRNEIEQRDRKRRRRRRNIAAAVAGTVMLSLAALAAIAWWQKGVADTQRDVALRGLSRYLASEADKRLDDQPQNALLLAVEAVRTTRDVDGEVTPAAERAIRRALSAAGGRPLGGHPGGVVGAAFSPDGSRVGTIGRDGAAKVWELADPDAEPRSVSIAPSKPSLMAFSPDGKWLALGGREPAFAGLWRIDAGGDGVHELGQPVGLVRALSFSPDGSRVVMASQEIAVRVWSLGNPRADPVALSGHLQWRSFRGEPMGIKEATFGPAGRWLVTSGWDGTARLWDLADPAAASRLLLAEDSDWRPAEFSRDGRWLALPISADGTAWNERLAVWRFDDGTLQRRLLADQDLAKITGFGGPAIIGFHPERSLLLAASETHVVLWDLQADPAVAREYPGYAAAMSGDGRWFATAIGSDGGDKSRHQVEIWSLQDLDQRSNRIASFATPVKRLTFGPQGRHLTVVEEGGRVWLLRQDVDGESPMKLALSGHDTRVESVAFSPNGRWLLTAPRWGENSARLWRVDNPSSDPVRVERLKRTPELEYKTRSGGGGVEPIGGLPAALAFDPQGRWLAAPGDDGSAVLVNLADPVAQAVRLSGHAHEVTAAAFSPDGTWLATADWNHGVRLWRSPDFDRPAAELLADDRPAASSVSALAVSPRGTLLATGGSSGEIALWNTSRPAEAPRMIAAHDRWITAIAFSPDGARLLTAGVGGDVKLWSLDALDAAPIDLAGHRNAVVRALFSDDGRRIVTAGVDSLVLVWSAIDPGLPPITLRGHSDGISGIALGSGGRWLVSGSLDGTVRLWDLQALDSPSRLLGRFEAPVNLVAMSVDQLWIAAADLAGEIRIWRRQDPDRPPAILTAVDFPDPDEDEERQSPWALGFSPDGRWLAALAGGRARLWRMRVDEQLELACALAGRNLSFDHWETHLAGIPYRPSCHGLGLHPDFIEQTERLAAAGEVERAVARFRVARTIDPELAIEPRAHAVRLAVDRLLEEGRRLARRGDADAALAELRNVLYLDPAAALDPQAEIERVVQARELSDQAERLASSGKVEEAVAVFRRAQGLDPSLDLDPEREASRLNAPRIQKAADQLAREGHLEEAAALYEQALEQGLRSSLLPATEARRVRASALLAEGREVARGGEMERAVGVFKQALALETGLRIDPLAEARKLVAQHHLKRGDQLDRRGEPRAAVAAYREALDLDPQLRINSVSSNRLCWWGVQENFSTEVLWLCDLAVASDPENGGYRDSRGVARVLSGQIDGAIEDFDAYLSWAPANGRPDDMVALRERWIARLQAGARPSSFAALESLGNP